MKHINRAAAFSTALEILQNHGVAQVADGILVNLPFGEDGLALVNDIEEKTFYSYYDGEETIDCAFTIINNKLQTIEL